MTWRQILANFAVDTKQNLTHLDSDTTFVGHNYSFLKLVYLGNILLLRKIILTWNQIIFFFNKQLGTNKNSILIKLSKTFKCVNFNVGYLKDLDLKNLCWLR